MAKSKPKPGSLPSFANQVLFNNVNISFTLTQKRDLVSWIIKTIEQEERQLHHLSFNFCSDKYLLGINKKFLNHDYYTDIITFDLSEDRDIDGDIYISVDRVKENAKQNKVMFHVELRRVIIHGVLHLCGYKDKTTKERGLMRKKEDHYLSLLQTKSHVSRET